MWAFVVALIGLLTNPLDRVGIGRSRYVLIYRCGYMRERYKVTVKKKDESQEELPATMEIAK